MEMVDCLLEYGADPAIIGEHDKTAGECAASKEIRKLIASPRTLSRCRVIAERVYESS